MNAMHDWPESWPAYLRHAPDLSALETELASVRPEDWHVDGALHGRFFHYGDPDAPALVLLPPTGMSFLLLSRLAHALSSDFHVVIKESKGCPDWEVDLDEDEHAVERQGSELARMVDHLRLGRVHLVGWCQAAQAIVHACQAGDMVPRTICLLAPAGLGHAVVSSEFERCALPIYCQIAEANDAEYAQRMGGLLDSPPKHADVIAALAERLSLLHLASPSAILRFSRYMRAFKEASDGTRPRAVAALSARPACIIHSRDDVFSHYSESVQLARAVPGVELKLLQDGGHLMMFNDAGRIADQIREFVRASSLAGGADSMRADALAGAS